LPLVAPAAKLTAAVEAAHADPGRLIDAQLPPTLVRWLQDRGYSAAHVGSIGMAAASDRAIALRAQADGVMLGGTGKQGRGLHRVAPARLVRIGVAALRRCDEPGVLRLADPALARDRAATRAGRAPRGG
jgi:hypothetical protein